ncbi:kinesin-domain-containing protein [Lentinus tigrinus ALCF2SS1-7]|uniref:Kinesin-like protein n=1 Tax=Lentinus tigrinus ALCF2SS1-6 TaxID=1328759 RepID=A0A5C2SL58_9APHY|nr:kinesin-domain-containing protein [Lentinus tigrinus ALCF2SS1-6]RPD76230.1 kinesin-domain-containing protein [Lentinus tigrinus ALCF2SS1-7]
MASGSTSTTANSLKRKAQENIGADLQPRKLAAIAEGGTNQPLRPSKVAPNANVNRLGKGPPPLTKPRAPALTSSTTTAATRRTTRATSAPPKTAPVRPPARPASRTTSARATAVHDDRFDVLQQQISGIEAARAADAARLDAELAQERAKRSDLQASHEALSRELTNAKSQELAQRKELFIASDELNTLRQRHEREISELQADLRKKDRELRELNEDLRMYQSDLERERETVKGLKATIAQQATAQLSLTAQIGAMQAEKAAFQTEYDRTVGTKADLSIQLERAQKRIAELECEAREGETVRRKLHNMVQELKGNIRVFCRVRPILRSDILSDKLVSSVSSGHISDGTGSPDPEEEARLRDDAMALIAFPDKLDHKEIVVRASSESATGQERKDEWQFTFDKVFEPHSSQAEVFEEISQLAQSCTDGYNVCVFAYGQTGSGKSFTMEGGQTQTTAGMIPRAVEQVFRVADELKTKGWQYKMEGQFLEIYNETINDLLGKGEFDKKKHEIKHDPKTGRTTVTDVNVVPLSSPSQVRTLLSLAQGRRTVAATLMNERSSRSHSVFTLRIRGENTLTGESCEGSLNLVDLAGSERLEKSGAASDKDRLRETQSINKSLSALGDVIAALGEKGEGKSDKHIPYRNSKLTYLLQNSLSGNSKTLMVLNLSPLATHLNESLCSLRFATKVNNTSIGTAKKQTK